MACQTDHTRRSRADHGDLDPLVQAQFVKSMDLTGLTRNRLDFTDLASRQPEQGKKCAHGTDSKRKTKRIDHWPPRFALGPTHTTALVILYLRNNTVIIPSDAGFGNRHPAKAAQGKKTGRMRPSGCKEPAILSVSFALVINRAAQRSRMNEAVVRLRGDHAQEEHHREDTDRFDDTHGDDHEGEHFPFSVAERSDSGRADHALHPGRKHFRHARS